MQRQGQLACSAARVSASARRRPACISSHSPLEAASAATLRSSARLRAAVAVSTASCDVLACSGAERACHAGCC